MGKRKIDPPSTPKSVFGVGSELLTHLRLTLHPHPCGVAGGFLHPEHLGVDVGLGDDAGTDDAGRLAEPGTPGSAARGEKHPLLGWDGEQLCQFMMVIDGN